LPTCLLRWPMRHSRPSPPVQSGPPPAASSCFPLATVLAGACALLTGQQFFCSRREDQRAGVGPYLSRFAGWEARRAGPVVVCRQYLVAGSGPSVIRRRSPTAQSTRLGGSGKGATVGGRRRESAPDARRGGAGRSCARVGAFVSGLGWVVEGPRGAPPLIHPGLRNDATARVVGRMSSSAVPCGGEAQELMRGGVAEVARWGGRRGRS
jgi:hypothetical protein